MSMSLANADVYISQIIGGSNSTAVKAEARNALQAAMEDLDLRHDFVFQRVDTSESFIVSCATTNTDETVTVGTGADADALKNVLAGMTVTGAGIPADTTVDSVTDSGEIELSAAATATADPVNLTFGGTIPIVAGTASYTLPSPFKNPYSCRLVSAQTHPLHFIERNNLDYNTYDQSVPGVITHYTLYNPAIFDADGTQQGKIEFWRIPQENDIALLRYYRPFDPTADPVDVPDKYLFTLLDFARVHLLRAKDATSQRIPALEVIAERRIRSAIAKDLKEGGENQLERMKSPHELHRGAGFTGVFYPRGDW